MPDDAVSAFASASGEFSGVNRSSGTLADRPDPEKSVGGLYFATDDGEFGRVYKSLGKEWIVRQDLDEKDVAGHMSGLEADRPIAEKAIGWIYHATDTGGTFEAFPSPDNDEGVWFTLNSAVGVQVAGPTPRVEGFANLRSMLSGRFGIQLRSTQDPEDTQVIFQTLDASPENPILVDFEQYILEAFAGSTNAALSTNLTGTNNDLVFTAVEAGVTGINVTYMNPGAPNIPLSIEIKGKAIMITLATNGSSVITTIASDIAALDFDDLVTVANKAGNNGTGLVTEMLPAFLVGVGQFDLVERDAFRRVFDGASAGGTPVLTSATMNWSADDVGAHIRVGLNPGRHYQILSRQSSTQVTLNANITLPSSGLTLTMDGLPASNVTIATKDGFPGVDAIDGWSRFHKAITSDKVYSVVYAPGDAGKGIYSITARALYHTDPVPNPEVQ